jgi:hypothetical protein
MMDICLTDLTLKTLSVPQNSRATDTRTSLELDSSILRVDSVQLNEEGSTRPDAVIHTTHSTEVSSTHSVDLSSFTKYKKFFI